MTDDGRSTVPSFSTQSRDKGRRFGAGLGVVVATTALLPTTSLAAAELDSDPQHCVLDVIGQTEEGEFLTADPVCFGTLAEALTSVSKDPQLQRDVSADQLVAAAAGVVAVHWDGADRTGASITISGADCSGGWLNLSSAWIDRISSTTNGCSSVGFFEGFGLSGAAELTNGSSVNLKTLDNASNSVQYG